jgi:phenylpyruvate tautomerase PptA (4-oxalocrotonate tautomerase family)
MPYLHLNLPGTYPVEIKRELATRLCNIYADVMQTQLWRPNIGIAELGKDNLFHLGDEGLEPVTMVLVEYRRGRSQEQRLELGRAIVDICVELLDVPRRTVLVEFTPHSGDELLRDGNWVAEWTPEEASTESNAQSSPA